MKKFNFKIAFLIFSLIFFTQPSSAANWIECSSTLCNVCSHGIDVPAYGESVSCGLFSSCSDTQFCCRVPFAIDYCVSIENASEVACPASDGSCYCGIDETPSLNCEDYGCAKGTPSISYMCSCTVERACYKDANGNEFSLYNLRPFGGKYAPGGYPDYDVDPRCRTDDFEYCPYGCNLTTGYCNSPTPPSPIPPTPKCEDSDKDENYQTKGICTDSSGSYEDTCIDSYTLKEYFCQPDNTCEYEIIDCREILNDNSAMCQNGKCVGGCSYSLTLSPNSGSYEDSSKTWKITVTDSSSGTACPETITYTISYSTSGSCSASTKPDRTSITLSKGGSASFNVHVQRSGDSCTLQIKIKDPNGNIVATGSYSVLKPPSIECTTFIRSINCPSFAEVNNQFTISWTFYYGEYCEAVCIALCKPDGTCLWREYSGFSAGDYDSSKTLTAPSTPGEYTYTLKLKGISCSYWDGSNPDSTKSCTVQVVEDTTPPEYEIIWVDLPCIWV